MPNIVLGVSGSIAAYRAADLARDLMRVRHTVRVCLTDAAQKFVTPALFEGLTGLPCLVDTFEEPESGRMAHIDWARAADVLLLAPATANTISKIANGIADDMLSTIALAYLGPIVVAPAMNPTMFASDATRASLLTLRSRAAMIVEPAEGDVACGEHGQGKLASNAEIVAVVQMIVARGKLLAGKRVLITSGPTQEPIDSVRFLSNRSSGKMGSALARAAILLDAEVTVISGPVREPLPFQANVIRVNTAEQMLEQALKEAGSGYDWIVGAAAVADYRPAAPVDGKLRRSGEPFQLDLVPNPDIISALVSVAKNARVVGFAAEPDSKTETAVAKIARKGLFAIAVNDVSRGDVGFDADQNDLRLIFADGAQSQSGKLSKLECALWLWDGLVKALEPEV